MQSRAHYTACVGVHGAEKHERNGPPPKNDVEFKGRSKTDPTDVQFADPSAGYNAPPPCRACFSARSMSLYSVRHAPPDVKLFQPPENNNTCANAVVEVELGTPLDLQPPAPRPRVRPALPRPNSPSPGFRCTSVPPNS